MSQLTQAKCIQYLEQIRWNDQPKCPYCDSLKASKYKQEPRYRCNSCYTSYSVTVETLFHKTHTSLPKWFKAIHILATQPDISIRQLAAEIAVNKNTAASIKARIQNAQEQDLVFLSKIKEFMTPS